jgi:hypothetical protein
MGLWCVTLRSSHLHEKYMSDPPSKIKDAYLFLVHELPSGGISAVRLPVGKLQPGLCPWRIPWRIASVAMLAAYQVTLTWSQCTLPYQCFSWELTQNMSHVRVSLPFLSAVLCQTPDAGYSRRFPANGLGLHPIGMVYM